MQLIYAAEPFIQAAQTTNIITVDTETKSLYPLRDGKILAGLGLKVFNGPSFYLDYRHQPSSIHISFRELQRVCDVLRGKILIFHNPKFDLAVLYQEGIDFSEEEVIDTVVLMRLVKEDEPNYKLKTLASKYIDGTAGDAEKELKSYLRKYKLKTYDQVPVEIILPYVTGDLEATEALYKYCMPFIEERGLQELLELEKKLTKALFKMEVHGFKLDRDYIINESGNVQNLLDKKLEEINKITGKQIDIKKLDEVIGAFKDLGLESPVLTPKTSKPSWAKKALQAIDHPLAHTLEQARTLYKIKASYYENLLEFMDKDNIIHCSFHQAGTKQARISVSEPSLQNVPRREDIAFKETEEEKLFGKVRGAFIPRPGTFLLSMDWCLAPETKILTEDLRWVSIETLKVGDVLIGIDEESEHRKYGTRRLKRSVVEKTAKRKVNCCKITLSNGKEITASEEHPWLIKRKKYNTLMWAKTKDLQPSDIFTLLIEPWEESTTYETGYLAGIFDGEGCLDKTYSIITFTQNNNAAADFTFKELYKLGFSFKSRNKISGFTGKTTPAYWITGQRNVLRFLGQIRPKRLLTKFLGENIKWFYGSEPSKRQTNDPYVVSIETIGLKDVISIRTNTHTFVAEGFFTHNSQIEVRIFADYAQEKSLIDAFKYGLDIHSMTAMAAYGDSSGYLRDNGKQIVFGLLFGLSIKNLAPRINNTKEQAQVLMNRFFVRFPNAKSFMREVRRVCVARGYLKNRWGRRRYLTEQFAYRGVNFLVQSMAAELMKSAIVHITELIKPFRTQLLLTVHDELIFEVPYEEATMIIPLIVAEMERPERLNVPIKCDVSWTPTRWSEKQPLECTHCKGLGLETNVPPGQLMEALYRNDSTILKNVVEYPCSVCNGDRFNFNLLKEYNIYV